MNILWGFVNSSFFVALITLVAGFIALDIYKRKQRDNKKDSANIILLEIQNAERQLKQVRENIKKDFLEENFYVMKTESWSIYKYLFVRNFDRDEWDAISEFYHKCQLVDSAVTHQSSFFQKNEGQLRINMQKITSDYIEKIIKETDEEKKKELLEKITEFQNEYLKHPDLTLYSPQKPKNDVKLYLDNWNINLSQTTIGAKLKRIAKLKN